MDNFVPPKPPEGLENDVSDNLQEFKIEDLDNESLGESDDSDQDVQVVIEKSSDPVPEKRLSKKGRSFFQRLFSKKKSSGSKLELEDSKGASENVSDVELKEAESIDDALVKSGLEEDVGAVGSVDVKEDVVEDVELKGADSVDDALVESGLEEDVGGVDVKEDTVGLGESDIDDGLFDESQQNEFKIGSSQNEGLSAEDLNNIKSALGLDAGKEKSIRESFEEDPSSFVNEDDSSSEWDNSFDEEEIDLSNSSADSFQEEVVDSKSGVVDSSKDFSDVIPVFEAKSSKSEVVFFKNFLNLTEKKIERLIRESGSKKKKDLLDKKRELVLLNSFEKSLKKIVKDSLGLLDKEVDKAFLKVEKKQKVLDKKLDKLAKKEKVILGKEKSLKSKESDLLKSKVSVEKDVASLNKVIDKLGKEELSLKNKVADLGAAKKLAESDLKILKNKFKDEEKSIKAKVVALNSSFESLKADLSDKESDLNNKMGVKQAELAKLEEDLVSTKNKVSAQLSKLASRESEIDKKQAELNSLIEEERKVLSLLELTKDGPSYGSLDESSDSFSESNSYDSFLEEIDSCKDLIKFDLDGAKLKYNKLRQDLLSSDFDGVEKKSLMAELKKLYDLIAKK